MGEKMEEEIRKETEGRIWGSMTYDWGELPPMGEALQYDVTKLRAGLNKIKEKIILMGEEEREKIPVLGEIYKICDESLWESINLSSTL